MKSINKWLAEIEQSKDGTTVIDINTAFENVFSRNIVSVSFGTDVSDQHFDMWEETAEKSNIFELRKQNFGSAFHLIESTMLKNIGVKFLNPLNMLIKKTRRTFSVTMREQIWDTNCKILRNFVMDYLQKRKSGQIKSSAEGGVDLLSLFLENTDVFTDEDIVDELIDFFGAASETT